MRHHPTSQPLLPGPGQAQDWLQRELDRAAYHQSLLTRLGQWVRDLLDRVGQQSGRFSDLGWLTLLGVVVVLVVVLAFVLSRLRRNPAGHEQRAVFADVRRSAGEHRELALAAFSAGDYDTCVVEAMRALAAGLVERALVDDLPAATAYEVVAQAQPRFPGLAERLGAGARVFDETRYGDHRATARRAQELLDLETATASASPTGNARGGPIVAVPR